MSAKWGITKNVITVDGYWMWMDIKREMGYSLLCEGFVSWATLRSLLHSRILARSVCKHRLTHYVIGWVTRSCKSFAFVWYVRECSKNRNVALSHVNMDAVIQSWRFTLFCFFIAYFDNFLLKNMNSKWVRRRNVIILEGYCNVNGN